jgi:hypothetical protein
MQPTQHDMMRLQQQPATRNVFTQPAAVPLHQLPVSPSDHSVSGGGVTLFASGSTWRPNTYSAQLMQQQIVALSLSSSRPYLLGCLRRLCLVMLHRT